jgi:hypothetical protein
MKKSKIFLISVVLIEISIILILTSNVLEREDINSLDGTSSDTQSIPQHFNTCEIESNNTKLLWELQPNCSTYFDGYRIKIPTTFIKMALLPF